MDAIESLHRADREADAMDREGVVLAQPFEHRVRRAARAHVILGVDLEEPDRL